MNLVRTVADLWRDADSRTRLRFGAVLILLLALTLAWSALASVTGRVERARTAREKVLKELMPLKAAYRAAKQSSDQLGGRMAALRPDDSPAKVLEEIGIKGKGLKITSVKGEERSGILEDAADVRIEGLTGNEALNLLYRIEKGSRPMVLKKATLRVRYDDPSRFDLAMVVALLKPAPGTAK